MNKSISYEKSFCAFLDILGFEALVMSSNSKDKRKVESYFHIIKDILHYIEEFEDAENIKILAISDSIILTAPVIDKKNQDLSTLRNLLIVINLIQYKLAMNNIWMRGGISFGEVSFRPKESFIVGNGYVKAYKFEAIAKYPRVILDPKIITLLKEDSFDCFITKINSLNKNDKWDSDILYPWQEKLKGSFSLNKDIPLFLDYLSPIFRIDPFDDNSILENIRMNLRESLLHYPKYKWLVDYIVSTAIEANSEVEPLLSPCSNRKYKAILQKMMAS